MNIVRKIKLDQLGYYHCKDDKEKKLFEFIKDNLLNLTQIYLKYHNNRKFYFKDEKCLFYIKNKTITLSKYNFKYLFDNLFLEEIYNLLFDILLKYYNIKILFFDFRSSIHLFESINKYYKNEYNKTI